MSAPCTHLKQVRTDTPRTPDGCEACLKAKTRWVHLRLCLKCGHVGCCDSSPGKHATKHFQETRHPLMRSMERGENWAYCYVDEITIEPAPRPLTWEGPIS
jgi:CPA1 family monovalent cation:H+ antiporter